MRKGICKSLLFFIILCGFMMISSSISHAETPAICFKWEVAAGEKVFFEVHFDEDTTINWGDDKTDTYVAGDRKPTHTYATEGTYDVEINSDTVSVLSVANKNIIELDVNGASKLETLYCYNNEIKTLDVTSNLNLKKLLVYGNPDLELNLGDVLVKDLYMSYNDQNAINQNVRTRKNYIDISGNGRVDYEELTDDFDIVPGDDSIIGEVTMYGRTYPGGQENYQFESTDNEVQLFVNFVITTVYESSTPNAPILVGEMQPVKYNGEDWIDCNEWDVDWYNYNYGKWANVRLKDGSMYVWIPRYTYRIIDTDENKTIEIKWSRGIEDYVAGDFMRHPAFFLGEYLGGDPNANSSFSGRTGKLNELTGFWVAKYMASEDEDGIHSKSGEKPVTKYGINEVFEKLIDMKEVVDMDGESIYGINDTSVFTHLTKNSEWGAITYLTIANGILPMKNYSTVTGGGSDNILQSSTMNVYGVFDLFGPIGEYTAGFKPNSEVAKNNGENLLLSYRKEYVDKLIKNSNNYYGLALTEINDVVGRGGNLPTDQKPFFVRGESLGAYSYGGADGSASEASSTGYGFRPVIAIDSKYNTGELSLFETEASVLAGDYLIITVDFMVSTKWKFPLSTGQFLNEVNIEDFVDLQFVQSSLAGSGMNFELHQGLNPQLLEVSNSTTVYDITKINANTEFSANERHFLKIKVGGYADEAKTQPIFINIKDFDSKIIVEEMTLVDAFTNRSIKIDGIPYDKIRLTVYNRNGEVYEMEEVGLLHAPHINDYDLYEMVDVTGGVLQIKYNGGVSTGTIDLMPEYIVDYDDLTKTSGPKNVQMIFNGKKVSQVSPYEEFNIMVSDRQKYIVTVDTQVDIETSEKPGEVTIDDDDDENYSGETVSLTASEQLGYKFSSWISNTDGFGIENSNSTITTFVQPETHVSVTALYSGVVSLVAGPAYHNTKLPTTEFINGDEFSLGDMILEATYKDGSVRYVDANTDGIRTSIPKGTVLDLVNDKEVTIYYGGATFKYTISTVKPKYILRLAVKDIEYGVINDGNGMKKVPIDGNNMIEESISQERSLSYTAVANAGYWFTGWKVSPEIEGLDLTQETITFAMPANDISITAKFALREYTVKYTSTDGGVVEGETIQVVKEGEDATRVEAIAEYGYYFTGWDDGYSNAIRQDTNIQEDQTYVACFFKGYEVSFFGYDHIQIGETQIVQEGEDATAPNISKIPVKDGYVFAGWSHDYTNVQSNLWINALYDVQGYNVTIETDTSLMTVEGEGVYEVDSSVVLYAVPKDGYGFSYWTLYKEVEGVRIDVTAELLGEDKTSGVARFTMPSYDIIAVPEVTANVVVGVQFNGVIVYSYFDVGEEVTIKTESDANYIFKEWLESSGLFNESQRVLREIVFTVPSTMTIISADYDANVPLYYTFVTSAGPNGSISPEGTRKVLRGSREEIFFTPDEGYKLSKVVLNGYEIDVSQQELPSIIFQYVDMDEVVEAYFEPI